MTDDGFKTSTKQELVSWDASEEKNLLVGAHEMGSVKGVNPTAPNCPTDPTALRSISSAVVSVKVNPNDFETPTGKMNSSASREKPLAGANPQPPPPNRPSQSGSQVQCEAPEGRIRVDPETGQISRVPRSQEFICYQSPTPDWTGFG